MRSLARRDQVTRRKTMGPASNYSPTRRLGRRLQGPGRTGLTRTSDSTATVPTNKPFVRFRDWTCGRTISTIGTNAGTSLLPFQRWRRFKEAFAPELVERAFSETSGTIRHIADPFGGSGTTALAAQFLGIRPTTIEVNPYLADLIEAKIASLDFATAVGAFGRVVKRVAIDPTPSCPLFPGAPATFVEPGRDGRYIFSRRVAQRIVAYRTAIESLDDKACKRLFRVILASTTIPASNVVVSGKGRRYRQQWRTRVPDPEVVDELFRTGVLEALHDLRRFASRRCREYTLLRGDARSLAAKIGPHDLAVFSPPYPNSFDYTDIYNVELWALGYLDGREGNARLRHATMRSHVQVLRDFDYQDVRCPALTSTIDALRQVRGQLWNRHIPEMIGAYVADLVVVMDQLQRGLRPRGRAYVVVGDSRYAGVHVPVARILTETVKSLGYRLVGLEPSRSMRSSPQQGGRPDLAETLVVLENP